MTKFIMMMAVATMVVAAVNAAVPVWHAGHEQVMNEQLMFEGAFNAKGGDKAVIKLASPMPFRVTLNGKFVAYGPARGPKGFFRLDEWPLATVDGKNEITVEVAGYNVRNFYLQKQPSFLQAEVLVNGKSVLETSPKSGANFFTARTTGRVRKINRYSYQRPFSEAYTIPDRGEKVELAQQPAIKLLPRRIPSPAFDVMDDFPFLERGTYTTDLVRPGKNYRGYVDGASQKPDWHIEGYECKDLELDLNAKLGEMNFKKGGALGDRALPPSNGSAGAPRTLPNEPRATNHEFYDLKGGEYVRFDHARTRTGFVQVTVECLEPGALYAGFNDISVDGVMDPVRCNVTSGVRWDIKEKGTYELEAFEPYVIKYIGLIAESGKFRVKAPRLRLYRNAESRKAKFNSSDAALNKIFAAAEETYAQNAVDVFTDCPSRERAGWLCDSFFTGRVSDMLTGNPQFETLFLENFAKPAKFDYLPEGMIPMCYPSDFANGNFIPSWAMFFVLELDEYAHTRGGDPALVANLKNRVFKFIDYLHQFRNSDGLLEKLPKWVFVEWSKANSFVQDVNYPNNMIWAATLEAVDHLYNRPDLKAEAERIKAKIREQSFNGKWFRDHAKRQKDGTLKVIDEDITETCQYYAFFFGTATKKLYPELWKTMITDFGPKRYDPKDRKHLLSHPEIWPSNAFIGNYLRLECLAKEGLRKQIIEETKGFFSYMAEQTGTLWENDSTMASCNHGFASHAAIYLVRDFIGVKRICRGRKTVYFDPPTDLPMQSIEVTLPCAEGELKFGWKRENGVFKKTCEVPEGWKVLTDQPIWPEVKPEFYNTTSDAAFKIQGAYFSGGVVSAANDKGQGGEFKLVKKFTLREKPVLAVLQGTADVKAEFSVNGQSVMKANWPHTKTAQVEANLKAGENEISSVYSYKRSGRNTGFRSHWFEGGVIAELAVKYADGKWEKINFDGKVSELPPAPPRAERLRYFDVTNPQKLIGKTDLNVRAKLGERAKIEYEFEGKAPEGDLSVVLHMSTGGGKPTMLWDEEFALKKENVIKTGENAWKLSFDYEPPRYVKGGRNLFEIRSNSIYMPDGTRLTGAITFEEGEPDSRFTGGIKAEMKMLAGHPEIFLNDKPFPLVWGAVNAPLRPDRLPTISKIPFTVVKSYPQYTQWHPKLGEWKLTELDREAEKYRKTNPDAYLMWDITIYPPPEFFNKFPEEISCDEDGDRVPQQRPSWSYASRKAMDEMREMVRQAITYVESRPYANRVIGYRINSGVTIEWLGWPSKPGKCRDFALVNQQRFKEFAAKYYPELKDPHVPSFEERRVLDEPTAILWDRSKHLNAIAYNDYNSWIVAEDVLDLTGYAKKLLASMGKQKLIGTYFGYTFFLNGGGASVWRGHYALKYLLDNNNGKIDYLMSPQCYGHQRNFGETFGEMKPFSTLEMAGIKPLIEDDTRTHNRIKPFFQDYGVTMTANGTKQQLRRNVGVNLCRGTSSYFYALATGFDLNSPECAEVGEACLKASKFQLDNAIGRHAEVALVVSERSVIGEPENSCYAPTGEVRQNYCPDGRASIKDCSLAMLDGEICLSVQSKFNRSGVSVDMLLAEDLDKHPGDYKLYVFLNQLTYDDSTLAAVRKLRERGASILWVYAPGYAKDSTLESMRTLTGMSFAQVDGTPRAAVRMDSDGRWMGMGDKAKLSKAFYPMSPGVILGRYDDGKPALTISQVGNSKTYFSGTWQFDMDFIKWLVKRAGAFVYSDSGDPMEANDAFVTLHARTPGVKTIRLPKKCDVYDVYNRRVVAKGVDRFSFEAELHETFLFYYGDAEKFGDLR